MAIQQMSVFVGNQKGALAKTLRLLADSGIDLRALSIADTADFGILRFIASNNEKAANTRPTCIPDTANTCAMPESLNTSIFSPISEVSPHMRAFPTAASSLPILLRISSVNLRNPAFNELLSPIFSM